MACDSALAIHSMMIQPLMIHSMTVQGLVVVMRTCISVSVHSIIMSVVCVGDGQALHSVISYADSRPPMFHNVAYLPYRYITTNELHHYRNLGIRCSKN